VRLWIDTDVGTNPDDAVALLCASAHPDVELVGVSTVDGDTRWRADVASTLVDVAVTAGVDLTAASLRAAKPDALLAIGPLTNVARLLHENVLPSRVTLMGGAVEPVRHRGRLMAVEHNFSRDAAAARAVIGGSRSVLVCPLDVTVHTCVDRDTVDRFAAVDERLRRPVRDWIESGRALCLHDPLALLAQLGEPLVHADKAMLVVGRDGRLRVDPAGRRHLIVTDIDALAAVDRIATLLEAARG